PFAVDDVACLPLLLSSLLVACLPDDMEMRRARSRSLLACLPNTRRCVSWEMLSDLTTARALGFAGIETSEVSTSSCLVKRRGPNIDSSGSSPSLNGLSGADLIALKPTDTARRMPASTSRRISSMRSDVPFGASTRCPRNESVSLRTFFHVPIGKFGLWLNDACGILRKELDF